MKDYPVQYRCPSGAGSYTLFGNALSQAISVTGLTNGVECDFQVAARDSAWNVSAFTTAIQATPNGSGFASIFPFTFP